MWALALTLVYALYDVCERNVEGMVGKACWTCSCFLLAILSHQLSLARPVCQQGIPDS